MLSSILAAAALVIASATAWWQWRSRAGQRQAAQTLHDEALRLDRRCDAVQQGLDQLRRQQSIDHLDQLVERAARSGRMSTDAAARLHHQIGVLRDDARRLDRPTS